MGLVRARRQSRIVKCGYIVRDLVRLGVLGIKIRQNDDGELVVYITRKLYGEALPSAAVLDQPVAIYFGDVPSKTVRSRSSIA